MNIKTVFPYITTESGAKARASAVGTRQGLRAQISILISTPYSFSSTRDFEHEIPRTCVLSQLRISTSDISTYRKYALFVRPQTPKREVTGSLVNVPVPKIER
jgi:hypothetical protein